MRSNLIRRRGANISPSDLESLEIRRLLSAGDVDLSFGTVGHVVGQAAIVVNNLKQPTLAAVVQQSDGKLIAAGADHEMHRIIVSRLSAKGDIDLTFAELGVAGITVDAMDLTVCGVAIDSSKRIVVAATLTDKNEHTTVAVARFLSDGRPDTSFSGDGMTTTRFGRVNGHANGIAVMLDSRIVVAGSADDGDPDHTGRMAVARFTTSGARDTSFSTDGLQTIDCDAGADGANAVAVLGSGSVILGGFTEHAPGGSGDFAVVKLTSGGQLDTSFHGNGIATADFGGGDDLASAMLVQSDGKIVLAGITYVLNGPGSPIVALARFTSTGAPDLSFSGDGKVGYHESTYSNNYSAEGIFEVLRTSRGGYRVLDGNGYSATDETRFDASGVLQKAADGSLSVYIPRGLASFIGLSDGTFAGLSNPSYERQFRSDAYTPTLSFYDLNDTELSSKGIYYDAGNPTAAIDSGGKLVLGSVSQTDEYLLYRFNADGKRDTAFGQSGRSIFSDFDTSAVSPTLWPLGDGRMILVSTAFDNFDDDWAGILASRMNVNGSRDPAFAVHEHPETAAGHRALLPHGNISVGYTDWATGNEIGLLVRSDGSSSAALVRDGDPYDSSTDDVERVLPLRHSNALIALLRHTDFAVDADGNEIHTSTFSIARMDEQGKIDRTFGNNGSIDGHFDLLDTTADGKILYIIPGGGLKRLNANGSPDATFGTIGVAGAGYTRFTVDEFDRIIAWKLIGTNSADVKIARYSVDGQLDKTFGGGDGIAIVHRPVLGDANVILTPTNGMVITSVKHTGDVYNWFATRLKGDNGAGMDGSTLRVAGSTNSDKISLAKSGTSIKVTVNGGVSSFAISSVKSIQISGNAGDDTVTIGTGLIGVRIDGGVGNDLLIGGSGNDTIYGGDGADALFGKDGNDPLDGGAGDDYLEGNAGNDILTGGAGRDKLLGQDGNDLFYAKDGRTDRLDGGNGTDKAQRDNSSTIKDSVLNIESFI